MLEARAWYESRSTGRIRPCCRCGHCIRKPQSLGIRVCRRELSACASSQVPVLARLQGPRRRVSRDRGLSSPPRSERAGSARRALIRGGKARASCGRGGSRDAPIFCGSGGSRDAPAPRATGGLKPTLHAARRVGLGPPSLRGSTRRVGLGPPSLRGSTRRVGLGPPSLCGSTRRMGLGPPSLRGSTYQEPVVRRIKSRWAEAHPTGWRVAR